MLATTPHIRYHIAAILAAHWTAFVAQYRRSIRPVVFENLRKVLACRTPVLGCHVYHCAACGKWEIVPHSCKSRFCPTCGKHATDGRADAVLNRLLDVPYHHRVLSIPWPLRILLRVIRTVGADLKWQPHIHVIVTGGGLSLDGRRWIETDPRFLMHHAV